jgi:hypothetical protein
MPKQAYIAVSHIDFGAKQVKEGARVDLEDDSAAQLLAVGAVRLAPAKAAKQPSPAPTPAPAPSEPPAPAPAPAAEGGAGTDQPPPV